MVRIDVREDEDNFKKSGPARLAQTEIDWGDEEHRRCITASLVKGTYVLQTDRTKKRDKTPRALAPAWWEAFHFRKLQEYTSAFGLIIYGAAFEYAPVNGAPRHPSSPTHIVAFRGTMPWNLTTAVTDLLDDFGIGINKQRLLHRFVDARINVQRLLGEKTAAAADDDDDNGRSGETIWLAGHSLGAAVALYVGHEMVTRKGRNLPAFLFNPPHPSAKPLVDAVLSKEAKRDLYILSHVLKGVLGEKILWVRPHREHMEELFGQLSHWVPSLYVHRKDFICSGFVDYFEQREQEAEEWSTRVANSSAASTLLYRDVLFRWHRKQSDWPHLLPCAELWTSSHGDDPHGLQQWWQPELDLGHNKYSWS